MHIYRDGYLISSGYVDAAMADSSILWIANDGVQPRRHFEANDYEVRQGFDLTNEASDAPAWFA